MVRITPNKDSPYYLPARRQCSQLSSTLLSAPLPLPLVIQLPHLAVHLVLHLRLQRVNLRRRVSLLLRLLDAKYPLFPVNPADLHQLLVVAVHAKLGRGVFDIHHDCTLATAEADVGRAGAELLGSLGFGDGFAIGADGSVDETHGYPTDLCDL